MAIARIKAEAEAKARTEARERAREAEEKRVREEHEARLKAQVGGDNAHQGIKESRASWCVCLLVRVSGINDDAATTHHIMH